MIASAEWRLTRHQREPRLSDAQCMRAEVVHHFAQARVDTHCRTDGRNLGRQRYYRRSSSVLTAPPRLFEYWSLSQLRRPFSVFLSVKQLAREPFSKKRQSAPKRPCCNGKKHNYFIIVIIFIVILYYKYPDIQILSPDFQTQIHES